MRRRLTIPNLLGVAGCILVGINYVCRDAILFPALGIVGSALFLVACALHLHGLIRQLCAAVSQANNWQLDCERCGFDLRGSYDGRCPECGAPNPKVVKTQSDIGPAVIRKLRNGQ